MSKEISTWSANSVQSYFSKDELVRLTAEQLMKDFAMFGIQITYSGKTEKAYHELHSQLVNQINSLIHHSYSKLISVLYRIDLSEKEIGQGTIDLPNYNQAQVIAHLIIVRELKKVLSRKFYSSNSSDFKE